MFQGLILYTKHKYRQCISLSAARNPGVNMTFINNDEQIPFCWWRARGLSYAATENPVTVLPSKMNSHGSPQMGFSAPARSFWGSTRQGTEASSLLFMNIMHNNVEDSWRISDLNELWKLPLSPGVVLGYSQYELRVTGITITPKFKYILHDS